MEKIVFLDRDGVICEDRFLSHDEYLHKKEDLELIKGSAEGIKLLNENGYKVIVISNQAAVARGVCSFERIEEIHDHLIQEVGKIGASIDKIYFCPHHPTAGDDPEFTKKCECRKPNPGMIFQAKEDFSIEDLTGCFMVGDKTCDLKAGNAAGCKTILVGTGYAGDDGFKDATYLHKVPNLEEAAKLIIAIAD